MEVYITDTKNWNLNFQNQLDIAVVTIENHTKITYSKYKAYVKKVHQSHDNAISEDQLQNLLKFL